MPTQSPAARAHAQNFQYGTVLSGTAAAAGVNGADQLNGACKGLVLWVDVTAFTGTSITITIQAKDPVSLKYTTILASAALAATGTTALTIYPGVTAAANVAVSTVVPSIWRAISTGTFSNVTYTVSAVGIV